jgi:hypothetical protein
VLHALHERKVRWLRGAPTDGVRESDDDGASVDSENDLDHKGYLLKEDTLTAMVFSRLAYLPAPLFWRLISESCSPKVPTNLGEIESVSFWPTWTFHRTATTSFPDKRVEPDLLVHFNRVDLIIEAKRRDGVDSQKPDQLAREIGSWGQLSKNNRADHALLLAVGGFSEVTDEGVRTLRNHVREQLVVLGEKVRDVPLFAMRWADLRKAIEAASACDPIGRRERILLSDILLAFDLHGWVWKPPSWFSSFAREIRALMPLDVRAIGVLLPRKTNAT